MQEQNMTKQCIIMQNENDFIILSKPLKVYLAIYHEFFFYTGKYNNTVGPGKS